ncbi:MULTISPECIES: hypothetical protein [unclassified Streptomyces]|uniref:hypothetical protein n=1 Tax=unclassified Streptomyces TaxID=2593676 RepID=UPI00131E73FF|nr:hypothetical protein [Streptomyces sp. CB01635]
MDQQFYVGGDGDPGVGLPGEQVGGAQAHQLGAVRAQRNTVAWGSSNSDGALARSPAGTLGGCAAAPSPAS